MATDNKTLLSESSAPTEVAAQPFDAPGPGGAVEAVVEPLAPAAPAVQRRRPIRAIVDLFQDLLIAGLVCLFLITYVVQAFKVQGTSMAQQLVDGERILVNKFIYRFRPIARGDVVVFWYPDDPDVSFIKRVIGLPGDTVEIRRGTVLVNGERVSEPYVLPENGDARSLAPLTVRAGHYFVLGDNRRGSNDSRNWGLVPRRYIYGRAFIRIWPLGRFGSLN